jgi:hypothetical protein
VHVYGYLRRKTILGLLLLLLLLPGAKGPR